MIVYEAAKGERLLFTPWWKGLQKRDREALNSKIDLLEMEGVDKCAQSKIVKWLGGDIYKFHTKGTVQLRPMFCKGPALPALPRDITLLVGAIEKDDVLDPEDAVERASRIRTEIMTPSTETTIKVLDR